MLSSSFYIQDSFFYNIDIKSFWEAVMDKKEYVARMLSRGTNKVYETYVINAIYQKVDNPNLIIETQKEMRLENGYHPLIDLYLPQLNIAVEVDEGQHAIEENALHDVIRQQAIISQARRSCIGTEIQFERVITYGVTLEELNHRIDEVVSMIRERIEKRTKPLVWKSEEELLDDVKKQGIIEEDDSCFRTNAEIINLVYGKDYAGYQKATYRLLWFPVMSDVDPESGMVTDRATWVNFFNQTYSIIYEKSNDPEKNEEKKKWALWDEKNRTVRIVFVRDRDGFGKPRKRFAGVFVAHGWDDTKEAQIWKKELTRIRIPLDEDRLKEKLD